MKKIVREKICLAILVIFVCVLIGGIQMKQTIEKYIYNEGFDISFDIIFIVDVACFVIAAGLIIYAMYRLVKIILYCRLTKLKEDISREGISKESIDEDIDKGIFIICDGNVRLGKHCLYYDLYKFNPRAIYVNDIKKVYETKTVIKKNINSYLTVIDKDNYEYHIKNLKPGATDEINQKMKQLYPWIENDCI